MDSDGLPALVFLGAVMASLLQGVGSNIFGRSVFEACGVNVCRTTVFCFFLA